jgi:hypothetical protein
MIDVLLSMTHETLKSLTITEKNGLNLTIIPHFVYDFAIFVVILHPVNHHGSTKGSHIARFRTVAQPSFGRVRLRSSVRFG